LLDCYVLPFAYRYAVSHLLAEVRGGERAENVVGGKDRVFKDNSASLWGTNWLELSLNGLWHPRSEQARGRAPRAGVKSVELYWVIGDGVGVLIGDEPIQRSSTPTGRETHGYHAMYITYAQSKIIFEIWIPYPNFKREFNRSGHS